MFLKIRKICHLDFTLGILDESSKWLWLSRIRSVKVFHKASTIGENSSWIFLESENTLVVCSNPSLKFVKEFLRFSLSRQGPWEENKTKNHKEWPQKNPMAIDSD